MKPWLLAVLALSSVCRTSHGQPIDETAARIESCRKAEGQARQECVEKLWRELYKADPSVSARIADGHWIMSETMSPLDYSPQVTATKLSNATENNDPSSLTIGCRGQRIEISVGTAGLWKSASTDEFRVAYRLNNLPEVQGRWAALSGGRGALFRGDAVRFLSSLPDAGQLWIRVHEWQGPAHEGIFQLTGLDAARQKITTACKSAPAKSEPVWR